MSLQYHEVTPSNASSAGFIEHNTIDFELVAPNRKLLKNSIVFSSDVIVKKNGANLAMGDKVKIDNIAGFHSLFESWTSEGKGQILENVTSYNRYVATVNCASTDINDVFNLRSQAEGLQCCEEAAAYQLQGQQNRYKKSGAGDVVNQVPANFAIMPKIVFNSMTGDDYSFEKNGAIRISCNLARNLSVLYGADCTAANGCVYTLFNPVIRFISVPDDGKQGAMLMNSAVSVKNVINSQLANISVRVPAASASGVVINFLKQENDNAFGSNSVALEKMPNLNSVQYLFNNSTSDYVSYTIEDKNNMVMMGLEALKDGGHNQANSDKLASNQGHLIGLNFEEMVDLRNQKFSVQLRSDDTTIGAKPRIAYLYFLNMISL